MDPVLAQIYKLVEPAAPYVLAAYGILWVGIFVYLAVLNRRLAALEDQLRLVEESKGVASGGA